MKDKRIENQEKRREKRENEREDEREDQGDQEKMRRDRDERNMFFFFLKSVSEPSNPPDELAQNVSKKKSPSDELFLLVFFESAECDRVFIYLHDSNSIFRAR